MNACRPAGVGRYGPARRKGRRPRGAIPPWNGYILLDRPSRGVPGGLRGTAFAALVLAVVLPALQAGSADDGGWDTPLTDAQREAYDRQSREAHARLAESGEDTMYASTPSPPDEFPLHLPAPHRWLRDQSAGQLHAAGGIPSDDGPSTAADEETAAARHLVAYFPAAADPLREGFVRIINHGSRSGTVDIHAVDDAGRRFGPLALSIGTRETVHFNSGDLEAGNVDKGLSGSTGPGEGDWYLELDSDLDIEVLAYVRTVDGFLTAMHDTVAPDGTGYRVAFFNPASNDDQVSRLRVVNVGDATVEVSITGVDDLGVAGGGAARFPVAPGATRTVAAGGLETGDGLDGALGDGAGKWRLRVESAGDIRVLNMLDSPTGHVTNLSTTPDLRGGGSAWTVPLFPAAAQPSGRQGFLRVISRDDADGTVTIDASDDTERDYDAVELALAAGETAHFNSDDLERGNADKGLSGGTGAGEGAWRLELSSELDIEVLAYVRTADGFLTAMHDSVPARGERHRVPVFNPASNGDQVSRLRVVNGSDGDAAVTVVGIDGEGRSPGGEVRFTVAAGGVRTVTARELETGDGLVGALGDGAGKWQLVVTADRPVIVMSLLESPTGHLTNLSTAGSRRIRSAEEVFENSVSPDIVQAKCVNCHVEGGVSGSTRLVFVPDAEEDHLARNLAALRSFVAEVDGGASLILDKIRGVSHGGGIQVAAGSAGFDDMRALLDALAEVADVGGPSLTADELFDTVAMESARRTLYRAALVFAGRPPTAEELAPFPGGTTRQLRDAILGMMTGPAFHGFLIRGANDRLLTDSLRDEHIFANGQVGTTQNDDGARLLGYESELERLRGEDGGYTSEYHRFRNAARHGAVQAPVEMIAHVAENDLPYTEILTADYIMANGASAIAYGDEVAFDDPDDPFEFRRARISGYRRYRVTMDDYPHAGILNTTAFLARYPTTATNRNRARSRWAYHHFLGFDIQNAAPTATDAGALLDTRNPTMHNPACTVCHIPLDPVAGAFQNYVATGFYRATIHGRHALDSGYISPYLNATHHVIEPGTRADREEIVEYGVPLTTDSQVLLRLRDMNRDQSVDTSALLWVEKLTLTDFDTGEVHPLDLGEADRNVASSPTGEPVVQMRTNSYSRVPIDIPEDARFDIAAEVWAEDTGEQAEFALAGSLYRDGDTWYRDMRDPGFEGAVAPDADTSLRWLGERMAADPRFAEGAVKFWWPAIMGAEVVPPPAEGDPDFDARLVRATAQAAEVARLAEGFRNGFHAGDRPYNLKDLLAAMVLSPWFRAERNPADDALRAAALGDAGARRLLTPEEFAAKTASITGYQWGRRFAPITGGIDNPIAKTSALTREYELLYGGIDSLTKQVRSRDVTATMASVAKAHAIRSGCPIILREFYLLPEERRRLFADFDLDAAPATADGETAIRGKLVELHAKLFGIEVDADSPDVDAAFDLFVETLDSKREGESGAAFRDGNRCDTDSDILLLDGVVDPPFVDEFEEYRNTEVQNDPDGLLGRTYGDPEHLARTWVVVLAYLMMDYRYLHL